MSARTGLDTPGRSACWCCGNRYPDAELIHLSQHPEVGVCSRCALSLHRRAVARQDNQHPSVAGRIRAAIAAVRNAVIERGWHQRPIIGAFLRRVDRHLP